MQILLTNDDGIFAPGLAAIYKKLTALGDVTVVAPSSSKSGASHSVTFNRPFLCSRVEIQEQFTGYSVEGSPADCVKLAVFELCKEPFDLLISGINNGANAGINIYYSGTVAAAMEGIFLKIPSIALSVAWEEKDMDFELAADYCFDIIKKILPLGSDSLININIPPLSRGRPKGIRICPQSHECFHEYFECHTNEQGQKLYQLAGGQHRSEEILTDTVLIADGFITITPLAPGRVDVKQVKRLKKIKF